MQAVILPHEPGSSDPSVQAARGTRLAGTLPSTMINAGVTLTPYLLRPGSNTASTRVVPRPRDREPALYSNVVSRISPFATAHIQVDDIVVVYG